MASAVPRVAARCCELYHASAAPRVLFCGGRAACAVFRSHATLHGVPAHALTTLVAGQGGRVGGRGARGGGSSGSGSGSGSNDDDDETAAAAAAAAQSARHPPLFELCMLVVAQLECEAGFLDPNFHAVLVAVPCQQRRLWLTLRRWCADWVHLHCAPPQVVREEKLHGAELKERIDYSFAAERRLLWPDDAALWPALVAELGALRHYAAEGFLEAAALDEEAAGGGGGGGGGGGSTAHGARGGGGQHHAATTAVREECTRVLAAREILQRHFALVGRDLRDIERVKERDSAAELLTAVKKGGDDGEGSTLEQVVRALPTSDLRLVLQGRNVDSRGMRTTIVPLVIATQPEPGT